MPNDLGWRATCGMTTVTVWFGSDAALTRLKDAVMRNCTCGEHGKPPQTCAPHAMLSDQRILNHMVFVFRQAQEYWEAEWACILHHTFCCPKIECAWEAMP